MNQRTRMFNTLACLVGAMTVTSVLLSWIDPSEPLAESVPTYDELLHDARSLVVDGVFLHENQWRDVSLLAGPPSTSLLSATPASRNHHFFVALDGRISRSRRWEIQDGGDDPSSTVRIQIARRATDKPMTRVQWDGVRALTAALYEALPFEESAIAVRLEHEWADIYDLAHDTVLRLEPTLPASG